MSNKCLVEKDFNTHPCMRGLIGACMSMHTHTHKQKEMETKQRRPVLKTFTQGWPRLALKQGTFAPFFSGFWQAVITHITVQAQYHKHTRTHSFTCKLNFRSPFCFSVPLLLSFPLCSLVSLTLCLSFPRT